MDPLSAMIALMRPTAVAWRRLEVAGACTLRFPAHDMVAFGQMLEGGAEVELPDRGRASVAPGDFILLPAPQVWFAHFGGGGPWLDLKALIEAPPPAAATARFVAGVFEFFAPHAPWLAQCLPPFLHVRGAEVAAGRLGLLLAMIAQEVGADRPGRSLALDRLLELALIEAIRTQPPDAGAWRRGLLAGLADARVGSALRALHADPARAWTIAVLAREAGLSRSAFAARFGETVGATPMDYLTDLRMQTAKAALAAREPLGRVAALAGYRSASAFSTAFRRHTGGPPGKYRRG